MRIVSTMRIVTTRASRTAVLQVLRALAGPLEVKSGLLGCRLCCDVGDANVLTWTEEWESCEALHAHIRSCAYRSLLEVMDMSASPPLLRFDTVLETAGLELVETARSVRIGDCAAE
ncbi:MAG TPA: antibiotic biosynthesis monooxygenase [Candidatus Binatia bacterium]|nr:antibiotic biosynthesis monooxygenase [Candidatus Binatia bacterium]